MNTVRIVIIDDHPAMREGLRRILEIDKSMVVVGEAGSGEDGVTLVEKLHPDFILLDIRLPGISGIEVIRKIREKQPDTNIVILTAYEDEQYLTEAIEAGATGYLLKDIEPDDLRRAIREACIGHAPLAPAVTKPLLAHFAALTREKPFQEPKLTERQLDILRLIAAGASNKDVAAQLYLSTATVKREMNRIFGSLDAKDRSEAVAHAYQRQLF